MHWQAYEEAKAEYEAEMAQYYGSQAYRAHEHGLLAAQTDNGNISSGFPSLMFRFLCLSLACSRPHPFLFVLLTFFFLPLDPSIKPLPPNPPAGFAPPSFRKPAPCFMVDLTAHFDEQRRQSMGKVQQQDSLQESLQLQAEQLCSRAKERARASGTQGNQMDSASDFSLRNVGHAQYVLNHRLMARVFGLEEEEEEPLGSAVAAANEPAHDSSEMEELNKHLQTIRAMLEAELVQEQTAFEQTKLQRAACGKTFAADVSAAKRRKLSASELESEQLYLYQPSSIWPRFQQ